MARGKIICRSNQQTCFGKCEVVHIVKKMKKAVATAAIIAAANDVAAAAAKRPRAASKRNPDFIPFPTHMI